MPDTKGERLENTVRDEAVSSDGEPASTKRKPKKKLVVLGVVAVILVAAGAGFWVWHEQPSFCATMCHDTMGSYLDTYENSDYLVARHADQNLSCLDCHVPTLSEQVAELQVQLSGDYRVPLAKMETDDEFCLRDGCHTCEEIEQHTVTTNDGTTVSPHTTTIKADAMQMQNPHGAGGTAPECSTCHTSHRASQEIQYCYDSCHHTETFELCSSCHDQGVAAI